MRVAQRLGRDRHRIGDRDADHPPGAVLQLLVDAQRLELLGQGRVQVCGDGQLGLKRVVLDHGAVLVRGAGARDLLAERQDLDAGLVETALHLVRCRLDGLALRVPGPGDVRVGHGVRDGGRALLARVRGLDGHDVRLADCGDFDALQQDFRALLQPELPHGGLGKRPELHQLDLGLKAALGLTGEFAERGAEDRGAGVLAGNEDLDLALIGGRLEERYHDRGEGHDDD